MRPYIGAFTVQFLLERFNRVTYIQRQCLGNDSSLRMRRNHVSVSWIVDVIRKPNTQVSTQSTVYAD